MAVKSLLATPYQWVSDLVIYDRWSGQNTSCSVCSDVGRKASRPRCGLCTLDLLFVRNSDIKWLSFRDKWCCNCECVSMATRKQSTQRNWFRDLPSRWSTNFELAFYRWACGCVKIRFRFGCFVKCGHKCDVNSLSGMYRIKQIVSLH